MEQQSRQDNNFEEEYIAFMNIETSRGWLVYKRELEKLINSYKQYMDNITVSPELLKNYQLIRYGLQKALDIPKKLGLKAKKAKNETKPENRVKKFFRIGY